MYNQLIRIKLSLILFVVSLLATDIVHAQPLEVDPTVKTGVLPNGFRYFIKANKYPKKRAVLYLANKVGSVLEDESERGLAHFIEHMNFKGTKHFPKNQLIDYLEKSGVRFGPDLNAYTSYDETVYQLPLRTDDNVLWKNGMQIMRDWASEALLDKDEFEKERGVILEEKRLQQNATGRMRDQYVAPMYNFSRYAYRTPIGLEEVVAKADIEVLRNFYKKWYRPDLQALIVVGDINVEQVEQDIVTLFSDLKPKIDPLPRPVYTIPLIDSTRFMQVKDKEYANHQIEILWKRKTKAIVEKEDFRRNLLKDVANSLIATRLQEVMREGSKPYLGVQMRAASFLSDVETFSIRIAVSPEKWEDGVKGAWTEVERIARYGFAASELQAVKDNLLARIALQKREKDKIASINMVEQYLDYFLMGNTYLSIEDRILLSRELLQTIKVEDILQFVRGYLAEKDRFILVMGTDTKENILPNQEQVLNWMNTVEVGAVKPYEHQEKVVTLSDDIVDKGKIVAEHKDEVLGMTHWVLSNGAEIYAKSTTFKNDEVLFSTFSKGGSSLYADADYYSAMNAPTFIVNSGLGNLNLSQLSQFLNAKAVQVMPYIAEREEGLNGASSTKDLAIGLHMLHLYMTSAKLDTVRFSLIKERSIAAMRNRAVDPGVTFRDTVGNVLGNYHFRRQPSSVATIEQIKADRVATIFKERFANAGDFTFVFVGNFELDSLRLLVEKYIGSLPAHADREDAKDLKIRVPKGRIRKDLRLGTGDKATVQLVYSSKYTYNSRNNLYLEALKSTVNFRLIERLRKQEGGVYSPSVQLTKAKQPIGFYAFVISFECDPDRKDGLIKAVREELDKLKKEGLQQEELDKFIAEENGVYEVQKQSNQFWISYIKGQLDKDEPLQEIVSYPAVLKNAKLSDINKNLKKIMLLDNEIIVTLSPDKD